MCGICGYYSFHQEFSSKNILAMNKAIQHRGPDDEGFWLKINQEKISFSGTDSTPKIQSEYPLLKEVSSKIALGFRRLSILDLSEKGHQPMTKENNDVVITFNGEIYNYKSLRTELQSLGFIFDSDTDTEVILNGYLAWGKQIFEKLDGMFAICIVDSKNKKLLLSRDRVGLKPLFYYQDSEVLVWASEIKALLKTEFIQPEIHWQGVYTNFLFQTTLAPETCFKGIYSLEPASILSLNLENNQLEKEFYWTLPKPNSQKKNLDFNFIDDLLEDSIAKQLHADVPVVSMMSGGIDSTLITAKAKKIKKDIAAFTIAYPFSEEEVKNASLVAEKIGLEHHIKKVTDEEVLEHLKENIQHFEEPYSSLEVLNNAAEYAKNLGFKVVLSGNGADELFAGYSHSLKLKKWQTLSRFNFIRHFIFTQDHFSQKVKNYFSQESIFDFFRQSQGGMKPQEAQNLLNKELLKSIDVNLKKYHVSEAKNYLGLYEHDIKYSLSSHHVFRDDLSAMKYSVEFRYPYLSNAIIDTVSRLNENFRYNGVRNKPILRNIAQNYIPNEVLAMSKRGFSFPLTYFIQQKKAIREFISENLESLKQRNFFNPKIIDEWWQNPKDDYDYIKVWQLLTFELWYQKYFENQ